MKPVFGKGGVFDATPAHREQALLDRSLGDPDDRARPVFEKLWEPKP